MENWFLNIFLVLAMLFSVPAFAQSEETVEEDEEEESLIQPQIERTEFNESLIDSEDFEISVYAGVLSIEDFGTDTVSGIKLAYHVNESFFIQAVIGESEAGETSFEVLSGGAPLLSDDERKLEFYQFNIGYNLFPGEAYITDKTTLNDAFYIIAGVGNTEFAGDDRATVNYGFGYRILFFDAFSFNADVRDHVFDMDLFGEEKETHNIEYSLALGWYF